MSHAQILEHEFEMNICTELAERGWLLEHDGIGGANGWDVARAMVPGDVLDWLQSQSPDEYEKAVPSDLPVSSMLQAQEKLLEHIIKELSKATKMDPISGHPVGGLLGVLRKGFKYSQVGRSTATFGPLMAFPPANPQLTSVVEQAAAMKLRVLRQVRFDTKSSDEIDVVLTANGLPIATMELKTDNTQSVEHAIIQYKKDRVPSATRPLLQPGRALVHFAVSNDLVYMTGKLEGATTTFLPFNKGHEGHGGNPPSETGSAANYLWRDILARPMFMRILKDFALYEPNRSKKNDGRLIFPRFHQLRAVERIVENIESDAPESRFLVQHSAGSGKTKTIAWLAHRLVRHMAADATSTFDSVIVVTDRTALDENIKDDINLVQSSAGLVVNIGDGSGSKSAQVKRALLEGGHIITCTLQTFPHVMKLIENTGGLHGRQWAIIADEAHSSQSGTSAKALKGLLVDVELDENDDITADDLLAATDSAIAQSANITFIALTATPKAKTLRLFGKQVPGEERWEAFDNYTMAQAIEEGFILDVLTNYSTYEMFLRVKNTLEFGDDEELQVETGRAVKDIVRFARLHPTAIGQKVQVVVEHFRRNVAHLLDGQARAMVVTSGRKDAVRWSEKMNAYIARMGYTDLQMLVAFSGTIRDDAGQDGTETSINGLSDVAKAFREGDEHKVLIVANKFQTGFDEPRLMAMYVDKVLNGITTVQTLSRLNRMYPGKTAPMVVDFVNDPAKVQKDFARYYAEANIEGEVDANALQTLAERLDAVGLYTDDQLRAVAAAYIEAQGGENIRKQLGPITILWTTELRKAKITGDKERYEELKQFRADAISYRNAWQFLSQIVDYDDEDLRLRAVLMSLLARNLHLTPDVYDNSYMENVDLAGVQLRPEKINVNYALDPSIEGAGIEMPGFDSEPNASSTKPQGPLDEAIAQVNELFSSRGVEAAPGSISGFITAYWGYLDVDEEAAAMAKNNTLDQLKGSKKFSDASDYAMFQAFSDHEEIRKALSDPEILKQFAAINAEMMHAKYHEAAADV